jgi:membrane protease YdiL (CAAX protease family)
VTGADDPARVSPVWRRCTEAALAAALWIGLGLALRPDPNIYLLLGVPITAAFQLWVRRRPLHTMWVRDAAEFGLDRRDALVAALLAAAPGYVLARHLITTRTGVDWVRSGWMLAAMAGAVGAAFAFRRFSRWKLGQLLRCVAITGAIGIMLNVSTWLAREPTAPVTAAAALNGVVWLLLYLPVAFVLEEVFFRGALDAHVHREGDARGLATAAFVAALWGLWHLPITAARDPAARELIWASAPILIILHVIFGLPLAIYWRRTGNLAVPATAHAVINAVRNALAQP